ncbi:MAG: putative metal-dependent hydrolase YcfH [Candidatus Celerinatantimonas neptuna]|nr:MAG: putative metal-dependent hydrolase YcfH [Candidatus Celerinatantimonas neptuna]
MLIDSHCHLDRLNYSELHKDPQEVLKKAEVADVGHILSVSISLDGYEDMRRKLSGLECISFSCGVHPLHAHESEIDSQRLGKLACDDGVVAIGETGLDYHYSPETKEIQQASFIEHLKVSRLLKKPVIIHTREARNDTLQLLRAHCDQNVGGVLHCFSEDYDMAMQAIEMGFYISASGIISFKSAKSLQQTFAKLPLDRLLVETDSPYLAPAPYRGQENQPAYTRRVAECLAQLHKISLVKLADATTENFQRLFGAIS